MPSPSTDAIITGLGLAIVLAIVCQLVASRYRVPAIVLLLPVGFVAGAITGDVDPNELFGATFQPLVSIGVGLILFEAGLRLDFAELASGARRVVLRLITTGVVITLVGVTVAVEVIFGLSWGVSALLAGVLVVSGPTVVLPLLSFVRPSDRVRSVLKWEGTLIDPIGALLGVLALHAIINGASGDRPFRPGQLWLSIGVGLGFGLAGAGLLWLLLRATERSSPAQGLSAALMVVTAAVVAADVLREDSGLIAAVVMGVVLAQQHQLDVSRILEFYGTVVELLIGILFVLISASVAPSQVVAVLPEGLLLIAIMVVVFRPLVVAVATWGSGLQWRERAFMAWMAPRGIVAAATASAFALSLAEASIPGANRVLPITFVVVFGTVVLYGLTAMPAARLLGVAGTGASVIVIIGGHDWARMLAGALRDAGVRVRLWTDREEEQAAAREAGIDARRIPLGVDVESREAELEEVSDALVVTESDYFNSLAAYELRRELGRGRVYRLAPRESSMEPGPGYEEGGILFGDAFTYPELSRRFEAGATLAELPADGPKADGDGVTPLVLVGADGRVRIATVGGPPELETGARVICLAEAIPAGAR